MPSPDPILACLLDGEELCRRLRISRMTLHRWRKERGLPALQIANTVRYDERAILEWLRAGGADPRPKPRSGRGRKHRRPPR